jgi:hypothetical protein
MKKKNEDREYFKKHKYTDADLKLFKKIKVLILSPIMTAEPKWVKCVVNMVALSWYFGLQVEKMAIAEKVVVDWARNALVEVGLKDVSYLDDKPFTHFLWLDADQIFDPDMLLQLARHDLDAVSALYYGRNEPHLPVAFVPHNEDPKGYTQHHILEIPPVVWEVGAFGFGACLIKREVFEKVPGPHWFTLDYRCGEDFSFCREGRMRGIKFHVDGSYKIGHIAPGKIISEKDLIEYKKEHPEIDDGRVKIEPMD